MSKHCCWFAIFTLFAAATGNLFAQQPPEDPVGSENAVDNLVAAEIQETLVTVYLIDGRLVTGTIDAASDESVLWLRILDDNIVLRSGFAWEEIDVVEHDSRIYNIADFRPRTKQLATELPKSFWAKFWQAPSISPVPHRQLASEKVVSLNVHAQIANWDGDAETDGLRVWVQPLNSVGELVAVDGQITFKLMGQFNSGAGGPDRSWRKEFPELQQWTRRISVEDFGPDGAVIQLPFRTSHPEFAHNLMPQGLLTARLSVAGQGVVEASDANLWLRSFSYFRDQLQHSSGRRYAPQEHPGRWSKKVGR